MKGKKNTTYQNLWNAVKLVLWEKKLSIKLIQYKNAKSITKFHLRKLEKEDQIKASTKESKHTHTKKFLSRNL